ncbi:MAG: lysine exporter LysO family protein [Proteocatella sp.]
MTKKILISVTLGALLGFFFIPESFLKYIGTIMDIGLCALLFFVGTDLGRNKEIFSQMKEIGVKVIGLPFIVALGSIFGAILAGLIFGYSPAESAAVGSGFAWYTLAPIIISPYSAELSAVAFLANVTREVTAILFIPVIAQKIGYLEAVSTTGAAGMDTLLPVVSKSTDSRTAIICFINGVVLTMLVPILVSFFIQL